MQAWAGGGDCYWVDNWGNCWSYQQVVDYWANLGYDYETGNYGYPKVKQQVQEQKTIAEVKVDPKDNSVRVLFDVFIDLGLGNWILICAAVGAFYVIPKLIKKWLGEK